MAYYLPEHTPLRMLIDVDMANDELGLPFPVPCAQVRHACLAERLHLGF